MLRPCNRNIQRTIDLSLEMISLADQGDAGREDTGCGILYGVLRDAGYKLLELAEQEKKRHQAKGWWPPAAADSSGGRKNSAQPPSRKKREDHTR